MLNAAGGSLSKTIDLSWPGTVNDPSSPTNGMWAKAAKTEGVPGVDEFFLYKLEARNQHHSAKILPRMIGIWFSWQSDLWRFL